MVAIKTARGPNVLAMRSISVKELLSDRFQIKAELSSEDGKIDFDQVMAGSAAFAEQIDGSCTELERGTHMVDAMITNTMLPDIGREFHSRLAAGSEIMRVHVTAKEGNFAFAFE